jgi:branched-chain amino acid transport system ATP-binding protein
VSLSVGSGEIVCLIGANGAGKTTALRCLSGLLPLTAGSIAFAGHDLARVPPHRLVEFGLAHVPEGRRIFARLTVLENLKLGAFLRRDAAAVAQDIERAFTLFPILAERRTQAGGTLSGGEQQMLAIARALMSRPRLLLMDEPSMGVAPLIVARIFEAIKALNREGLAILLVEQNARMALAMANRGYVLETGRITVKGLASHLATDERVKRAYLGG